MSVETTLNFSKRAGKGDLVVGVAIEDSRPVPGEPEQHDVLVKLWGPAQLNPPAKNNAVLLWLSFLCGAVIGSTIVGLLLSQ